MVVRHIEKVFLNCKTCNEPFKVHWYRRNIAKYCNKDCNPFMTPKIMKKYECCFCNNIFKREPKSVRSDVHFCSYRCKGDYQKTNNWKKKTGIYKKCLDCKKEYYVNSSRKNIAKYCSYKCSYKNTLFKIGQKAWNYIHGLKNRRRRYGIDWGLHRLKVLVRDTYTCQFCYEEGNHVDHIIPFRMSKDNSLFNLQTLCISCHCKKTNWECKAYG